jgi:hypothetical protein
MTNYHGNRNKWLTYYIYKKIKPYKCFTVWFYHLLNYIKKIIVSIFNTSPQFYILNFMIFASISSFLTWRNILPNLCASMFAHFITLALTGPRILIICSLKSYTVQHVIRWIILEFSKYLFFIFKNQH